MSEPERVPPIAACVFGFLGAGALLSLVTRPTFGAVVLVGLGVALPLPLWRRRPWATWLAAVAAPLVAVGGLVWVIKGADEDPGDGSAYAAMGALEVIGMALFLTVGLLVGRYRFRHPRKAWYADPDGAAAWRYWDGHVWTDHTSPM